MEVPDIRRFKSFVPLEVPGSTWKYTFQGVGKSWKLRVVWLESRTIRVGVEGSPIFESIGVKNAWQLPGGWGIGLGCQLHWALKTWF